jgi:hypothetical protein
MKLQCVLQYHSPARQNVPYNSKARLAAANRRSHEQGNTVAKEICIFHSRIR